MAEKEFDLLHEPWIRVLRFDANVEEVSLLHVFAQAENYRGLGGEVPTQNVAVLRLLLSILHTVVERIDAEGHPRSITSPADALERWQNLWEKGRLPYEAIERYLLHYEDRFWLFHDEFPFYQIPGLDERGTAYKASKLNGELLQSNNKVRLFASRTGDVQNLLGYSEAAVWLLHAIGFDDNASKSTVKGLPSPGAGWLGQLGLMWAEGDNLLETLLLNLILLPNGADELGGSPNPVWERKEIKTAERTEIPFPNNLAALYTLQSRRIMLQRSKEGVYAFRLIGGDFFSKENALLEQMTLWRKSKPKKGEQEEIKPRRHDPAKQVWRNLAVLVGQADDSRRPGIVGWLARLKAEDRLKNTHFGFRIAGAEYGDKDFFIQDLFEDSLQLNGNLLTNLGEDWLSRIIGEISVTERLVWRLGVFANELALAAGDDARKDGGVAAREQAYFKLDRPFRQWLEAIDPIRDADQKDKKCEEWWLLTQDLVRREARDLLETAGSKAFVGREQTVKVKGKETKRRYTAPEAYNSFLYNTASREALFGKGRS